MNRVRAAWPPIAFGVVFLVGWEATVRLLDIQEFLLPRPSSIASALGDEWAGEVGGGRITNLREAGWETGKVAVLGLVLGVVLGALLALATTRFRLLRESFTPLAVVANATPIVALAPIFNKEMKECVAAGAEYLQIEDLGAWLPLFTNDENDYKWIRESIEMMCDGVDAKIGWHFCFGNAWGNDILSANFPQGYQTVLPHLWNTEGIDEFVLDYANRHMDGIDFLKNCPKNKGVQVGVLDIRTNMLETPEVVADRARQVIKHLSPEQVTLSTDCGMKPLARMVAKMKLAALAEGAAIVRKEIGAG